MGKIIEFMEIHRIFGIKNVILYDLIESTKGVMAVIKYYLDIGFLSKSSYVFVLPLSAVFKYHILLLLPLLPPLNEVAGR